jgi:hypothetical protein
MVYSLWEFLTFTPQQLRERERTMTFEEREQERLKAASRLRIRKTAVETAVRKEPTK